METNVKQIIFTTQPQTLQCGLNEIIKICPMVKFIDYLDLGVARVELNTNNYNEFINKIINNPPIFVRHICPVNIEIDFEGKDTEVDILEKTVDCFIHLLDKEKSFSVQT